MHPVKRSDGSTSAAEGGVPRTVGQRTVHGGGDHGPVHEHSAKAILYISCKEASQEEDDKEQSDVKDKVHGAKDQVNQKDLRRVKDLKKTAEVVKDLKKTVEVVKDLKKTVEMVKDLKKTVEQVLPSKDMIYES